MEWKIAERPASRAGSDKPEYYLSASPRRRPLSASSEPQPANGRSQSQSGSTGRGQSAPSARPPVPEEAFPMPPPSDEDNDDEQSTPLRRRGSELLAGVSATLAQYKVRCRELEEKCEALEHRNQALEIRCDSGEVAAERAVETDRECARSDERVEEAEAACIRWKMVAKDSQAKVEELEAVLATEMLRRARAEDAQIEAAAQRDKLDHELRTIVDEIGTMRELFLSIGLQAPQQAASSHAHVPNMQPVLPPEPAPTHMQHMEHLRHM